ncbi:MAG: pyridoxine 5'-phosphate synthase [Phycisphaeraceae bacterium]|nr:pyridoxine 5'-phosphate synthase [Phycisphaeraceae bacterium]
MPLLGVNIDHVATIRQARRGDEPDPVRAAHEAEMGGADIITVHLREDRRHINDGDVERLAAMLGVRLNLEMAATEEMTEIALRLRALGRGPHECALVPEGRDEITTEGGLDVARNAAAIGRVVARLSEAGIRCSAFIDADPAQIDAAKRAGFAMCEVHTGPYARAFAAAGGDAADAGLTRAIEQVADAGRRIRAAGMRFNAGHGLNYQNVRAVASLVGIEELHIGHSIVSRAVYTGLREAVVQMKAAMAGV